ncbi:unnamed protein product [Lathyrus oleraceus]
MDEARDKHDNTSYGGIIRGSGGEWLRGFFKSVGMSSVYIVELWDVLEGLKLAMAMDFWNIIVEVDSQQVIKDITMGDLSSNMGRHLITSIITLMHQDREIKIHHIYKESNMCADALAREGRLQSNSTCILEECPSFLNHIIVSDLFENSISQLIPL